MKSVLLIDSDSKLLLSLELQLQAQYRIFTAKEEGMGLAILDANSVDLCVLDFFLEGSDGRSLFLNIRQRFPSLPCILITARADKKLAIEALNLGVNCLLEKPIDIDELRGHILKFLPESDATPNLHLYEHAFTAVLHGDRILLTPIEFRILQMLWEGRNRLVRREEICSKLWGKQKMTDHNFDTHFSNMKRKLPALRDKIIVIRGQGYVLRI